jgi:hypothetical protein
MIMLSSALSCGSWFTRGLWVCEGRSIIFLSSTLPCWSRLTRGLCLYLFRARFRRKEVQYSETLVSGLARSLSLHDERLFVYRDLGLFMVGN